VTPDCQLVRDLLEEHRRGELAPDAAQRVEAHLAGCSACRARRAEDDALAALVRTLPVTSASPALRRRIQDAGRGRAGLGRRLGIPVGAAAAAALVVALALSPWLQFRGEPSGDPVESLIAAGVTEHRRILLQIQDEGATDPARAFARVYALTDIELPRAFAGGPDFRLVAARPTLIANRKAAAVVLSFESRSVTTYFAVPAKDLPMPAARRVQIEQYRPYLREVNGFRCVYWKQGDLAYLMVTDLDDSGTRRLFLRMRKAL